MDEEDELKTNIDEEDKFRLPKPEEGEFQWSFCLLEQQMCKKKFSDFLQTIKTYFFWSTFSRTSASRPEGNLSADKGQHWPPVQFLNKKRGGERPSRLHLTSEKRSLHLLQLQRVPHWKIYGPIPSFRGVFSSVHGFGLVFLGLFVCFFIKSWFKRIHGCIDLNMQGLAENIYLTPNIIFSFCLTAGWFPRGQWNS